MDSGSRVLNLRSRCKHKAWGASPRITNPKTYEPANAGDSVLFMRSWGWRPRLYAYTCFAG